MTCKGLFAAVLGGALLLSSVCGKAQSSDNLLPALERLGARNNPEAIYHIGMAYQTGSGVEKDTGKALEAFRRAAALGDPLASYKLGCIYNGQGAILPRDRELALRHKLRAAEAGYALAQQDVAALYLEKGQPDVAVVWLERAARQGWPDALAAYASVYNGAAGVTPDPVRTAAYLQLFLARSDVSEEQRDWLKAFELRMTPEQRRLARKIVKSYRPQPTALTIKALAGRRAAALLVAYNP